MLNMEKYEKIDVIVKDSLHSTLSIKEHRHQLVDRCKCKLDLCAFGMWSPD